MPKYLCCNLMINCVSTQIYMTALKKAVIFLKSCFRIQLNLQKSQWKGHGWIYFFEPNRKDHDLLPPRLKKDQFDIQGVYYIINSVFVNPSLEMKSISLPTGTAPSDEINFLDVHSIREIARNLFMQEHLINRTIQFFEPLRKLKLRTFSFMKKVVKVKKTTRFNSAYKVTFLERHIGPKHERDWFIRVIFKS